MKNTSSRLWLVTVFVLLGAALRLSHLGDMRDILHFDEAYYGVDALTLLKTPHLTPFFANNNGRESLWMYVLTPALALLGAQSFALRITAIFVGILTLAAMYRLARELLGKQAAPWAVGVLAVLYWHVHLSHVAFRAILLPLIGALVLAALLGAWRRNRWRDWLWAGLWLGLFAYTYFAARLLLGGAAVWLIGMFIVGRGRRTGAVLAGGLSFTMMLPLIYHTLTNPKLAMARTLGVAIDGAALGDNIRLWLEAWLWHGSTSDYQNFPGLPILDVALALLCGLGLITLGWHKRSVLVFCFTLAGVAVLPSLFSGEAPHYLRAFGVVWSIALLGGAGAAALERRLAPHLTWSLVPALSLIVASGMVSSYHFGIWLAEYQLPEWKQIRLERLYAWRDYLAAPTTSYSQPLYYVTDGDDLPLLSFLTHPFGTEPLDILDFPQCTLGRVAPFQYTGVTIYEPSIAARWGRVTQNYVDPQADTIGWGYGLYTVTTPDDVPLADYGGVLRTALVGQEQTPTSVTATLRFQALQPLTQPYTLFMHVYPLDEERLIAQTDIPLCPEYPPARWYPDRAALVTATVTLPPDLASGTYRVVLGMYTSTTLERLTVGADAATYKEVTRITVP